jgi:hypothetical protein
MEESFRKRVSYRPKPDLNDLFAAEKRQTESDDSSQGSLPEERSSEKLESSDIRNNDIMIMSSKSPRAGFKMGSPVKSIKKRKRQKKSKKLSLKGVPAGKDKQTLVGLTDLFNPHTKSPSG